MSRLRVCLLSLALCCWLPGRAIAGAELIPIWTYDGDSGAVPAYTDVDGGNPACLETSGVGACGFDAAALVVAGCEPDNPSYDVWIRVVSIDLQSKRRFGGADGAFFLPTALDGHMTCFLPNSGGACAEIGTTGQMMLRIADSPPGNPFTDGLGLASVYGSDGYESTIVALLPEAEWSLHGRSANLYLSMNSQSSDGNVRLSEAVIESVWSDEMPLSEQHLLGNTTLPPGFVPVYVNSFDHSVGPEGKPWHSDGYTLTQSSLMMNADGSCDSTEFAFGHIGDSDAGITISLPDLPPHDIIDIHVELMTWGDWHGEGFGTEAMLLVDDTEVFRSSIATEPSTEECWPLPPGCAAGDRKPEWTGAHRNLRSAGECSPPDSSQLRVLWYFINQTLPHTGDSVSITLGKSAGMLHALRMASLVVAVHPVDPGDNPLPLEYLILFILGGVLVTGMAAVAVARVTRKSSGNSDAAKLALAPSDKLTSTSSGGSNASSAAAASTASVFSKASGRGSTKGSVSRSSRSGTDPKGSVSRSSRSGTDSKSSVSRSSRSGTDPKGSVSRPSRSGTDPSAANRRQGKTGSRRRAAGAGNTAAPKAKRLSLTSSATMMTSGSAISHYGIGDDYGES